MCNQNLKQTAISLSSCEAEFYAASACAREDFWVSQNFSKNFTTTFQFVSRWIDAWLHNNGSERQTSIGWTREHERQQTLQIFSRNFWMDRARGHSQRNLDFKSWEARVTLDDALPVEQGCKYSQYYQWEKEKEKKETQKKRRKKKRKMQNNKGKTNNDKRKKTPKNPSPPSLSSVPSLPSLL